MKPLVEKERLDCRLQRASSVNGWHCSSISASSPSRYPRNAVPQIFAYEPKPGVFRNLNYPAFHWAYADLCCLTGRERITRVE